MIQFLNHESKQNGKSRAITEQFHDCQVTAQRIENSFFDCFVIDGFSKATSPY